MPSRPKKPSAVPVSADTSRPRTPAHLLHARLKAEAELFRAYTAHTTLTGGGREHALRGYLEELLPRRYELLTGGFAILDGDYALKDSQRQQDLLVVDTWQYPTLYRKGSLAIVMPESVAVMIESKSTLNGQNDMCKALGQTARGQKELRGIAIPTVLFGFETTSSAKSLRTFIDKSLDDQGDEFTADSLPDMIVTLAGIVARKASIEETGGLRYDFSASEDCPEDAIVSLIGYVLEKLVPVPSPSRSVNQGAGWSEAIHRLRGMLGTKPAPSVAEPLVLPQKFKFRVASNPATSGDELEDHGETR